MRKRPCPTPRKRRFRDRIGAALFAARDIAGWRRNGSNDTDGRDFQEPYECPCGRWHVRTVSKREGRS